MDYGLVMMRVRIVCIYTVSPQERGRELRSRPEHMHIVSNRTDPSCVCETAPSCNRPWMHKAANILTCSLFVAPWPICNFTPVCTLQYEDADSCCCQWQPWDKNSNTSCFMFISPFDGYWHLSKKANSYSATWLLMWSPTHHPVMINAQCESVLNHEALCSHLVLNEPAQQKCLHSEADAQEGGCFSRSFFLFYFFTILKIISKPNHIKLKFSSAHKSIIMCLSLQLLHPGIHRRVSSAKLGSVTIYLVLLAVWNGRARWL